MTATRKQLARQIHVGNLAKVEAALTQLGVDEDGALEGGASFPDEWTVGGDGQLTIDTSGGDGLATPLTLKASAFGIQGSPLLSFRVGSDVPVEFGANGELYLLPIDASITPLSIVQHVGQSVELVKVFDSDSFDVFGINKNGYAYTRKLAAPADNEVVASQLMFWFDDTNGAAKLMIKGKSANGTVVSGEVALA